MAKKNNSSESKIEWGMSRNIQLREANSATKRQAPPAAVSKTEESKKQTNTNR